MIIIDHFENASSSFRRNRGRNLLATLGVAIGVGSIVAILALSGGLHNIISQQVSELNNNLIVVRPGVQDKSFSSLASSVAQYNYNTSTITESDVEAVRKMPHIRAVAPMMTSENKLKGDGREANATVVATSPDLAITSQLELREGDFLEGGTHDAKPAVLGPKLSVQLFGTEQSIGQTFKIRGKEFIVVGVMRATENPLNYNNVDFDNAAIITTEAGKKIHSGHTQIQQINIQADAMQQVGQIAQQVKDKIKQNHQGEEDFTVATGDAISQPTNRLFTALTQVLTLIAAISLVVGGIGIMNIMLVSVVERTREVGIRKAVGATDGNIITQFVIEALAISLLGGILGYILGYIVALSFSVWLSFPPALEWQTAVMAIGLALAVGLTFGLYPAIRAARKNTIESLRQYH